MKNKASPNVLETIAWSALFSVGSQRCTSCGRQGALGVGVILVG